MSHPSPKKVRLNGWEGISAYNPVFLLSDGTIGPDGHTVKIKGVETSP